MAVDGAERCADARIVWANAAATAVTGFARDELVGASPCLLFGAETGADARARLTEAMNAGEPVEMRVRLHRRDGEAYWSDLALRPSSRGPGGARRWFWLQRDVTEETHAAEERRALYEKLEATSLRNAMLLAQAHEALAAKSSFLATVSHELRTPLNGVVGMAKLLASAELTKRQARMASAIEHSGRHLFHLITDVLEMSRAEVPEREIAVESVDIDAMAEEIVTHFTPEADDKGLAIAYRREGEAAVIARTDPMRARQILFNLVSNAVKYTVEGAVEVSAARAGRQVVIDVADTGAGVEPEAQGRIFEEYVRCQNAHDLGVSGVGIGLSVVAKLVDALGGAIFFCSQPGEGTRFRVRLPAGEPS